VFNKLIIAILVLKDRLLVRFIPKDSDLSDPILKIDLDILKPFITWLGLRMPVAFEETAFGLAVDVSNSLYATMLFKGFDLTEDFGKCSFKIVILLA
jgi:hypothetical protein